MIKRCSHCGADYWGRWRNEPTTLCPDCRDDAVLCASCGAVQRPPPDRAQLTLWPMYAESGRAPGCGSSDHYIPPPRSASQAAKRKYPYQ